MNERVNESMGGDDMKLFSNVATISLYEKGNKMSCILCCQLFFYLQRPRMFARGKYSKTKAHKTHKTHT